MTDTTIKLLFSGVLAVGGIIAAIAVSLAGMCLDWPVADILAINIVFSNVVVAAMGFFFGHQNGVKNGRQASKT